MANSLEGTMRFFFWLLFSPSLGHERRGERMREREREWKVEKAKNKSVSTLCRYLSACINCMYVEGRNVHQFYGEPKK